MSPLDIVILGLSITSSWGNGHATTYRGLVRALVSRGHRVLFLERDMPWYAENRDLPRPTHGRTDLYASLEELRDSWSGAIAKADLVMVGSYVPEGREVCRWVQETARGATAFYDIDTPVTLSALSRGDCSYLEAAQVSGFALYLTFTGGPTLARLENDFGARRARPLYCSFDDAFYYPDPRPARWEVGYMGTYSADRQPMLESLLVEAARSRPDDRFVVAGPLYPAELSWPVNVERITHLAPAEHRAFFGRQRFTLNVTRAEMRRAGYSPSVRLFEAAACAVPVISDFWPGIDTLFTPGREIWLAESAQDVSEALSLGPEQAQRLGQRARHRVMAEHTALHRAAALEGYLAELRPGAVRRRVIHSHA